MAAQHAAPSRVNPLEAIGFLFVGKPKPNVADASLRKPNPVHKPAGTERSGGHTRIAREAVRDNETHSGSKVGPPDGS